LINIWDKLWSSFLFLPLFLIAVALVLAVSVPRLEIQVEAMVPWLVMTPESSQKLLAAVATSMMTMASLVFSITIVTLSIATSQLGPRLLRKYMSMRSTQTALGLFVGTGIYAIVVLMTVRNKEDGEFVPYIAVTLGVLLTLLSLVYLIYFIHRISYLIQAPNAVQSVAYDLDKAIERLYPERFGAPAKELSAEDVQRKLNAMGDNYRQIPSEEEGYLQSIDTDGLMELAKKHDLILQLHYQPGQFVLKGAPVVKAWPAEREKIDLETQLNRAFITGNRPTPRQDVESSINELVELALRALSPALNDPFTAINCIDRLAASLSRLAQREIPTPYRLDDEGNLRLVTKGGDFSAALSTAFDGIRRSAAKQPGVQMRLLESLALVGKFTHREEDRVGIQRQADMIREAAEREIAEPNDLAEMKKRYQAVQETVRQAAHVAQAKPPE